MDTRRRKKQRRKERRALSHLRGRVLELFSRGEVEDLARECGFYRREPREIRAFEFALCCAFASMVEGRRGFAAVWRLLAAAADITVARSAVTQRFGEGSAQLMQVLFERVLQRIDDPAHPELLGKLEQFERVLARDGTVLKLSPLLGKLFPATRTNSVQAAAKLHATSDLVHRRVLDVVVTGERKSELDVARAQPVQRGTLYIEDLGYYSFEHFKETMDGGGDILSRLKSNANPFVINVRHGVRAPKRSEGMRFQDIEFTSRHDTFDLDAAFPTKTGYVGLRVVGRRHPETGEYHCYVTSLPPDEFTPEELADLYSLRWVAELLFKLLKSSCHLDHLDTSDPNALRTHIYASLLASALLFSLRVAAASFANVPSNTISPLVAGIAAPLLTIPLLMLWCARDPTPDELAAIILRTLAVGCRDQNVNRTARKWGRLR